ncbi:MAG: nucleoside hydrolase, partial [Lentisphaeria bacterium]|nr:nucleoside hydrolase [Lentisphaeria bacterium]
MEKLPIMAVLDTDTYNEVDDQFTLAYALLAPEAVDLRAVIAAPFSNFRAATPGEGMQKSYDEICRILAILGKDKTNFAWHGSTSYLPDRNTPVDSEGARRIIELAREAHAAGRKLHVLAIAAITDVASALLLEPEIARDIVIVWLSGNDLRNPD